MCGQKKARDLDLDVEQVGPDGIEVELSPRPTSCGGVTLPYASTAIAVRVRSRASGEASTGYSAQPIV